MIGTISVARFSAAWVSVFTITLVWSDINPKDLFTWILEVTPATHYADYTIATS